MLLSTYYRPVFSSILRRGAHVQNTCCQTLLARHGLDDSNHISTGPPSHIPDKYFITTPIFYVNAAPHIGHLYTAVLSDAISRWYRVLGIPVRFSTGTDEHGLKVQQAAAKQGVEPKQLCDQVSGEFKRLFRLSNIQHTDYIRTTEHRHRDSVHRLWGLLEERGHIYKGTYEGWYCTADEAFVTPDQVMEVKDKQGNEVKVSAESGQLVEWTSEHNYMFRLSEFAPQLLQWLDKKVIKPAIFESQVRQWIQDGLADLSISRHRDRLQWGIPVPSDDTQTVYVWMDALANYLTVAGYPQHNDAWPADCHVVGKDILRFHAVYWPAFLIAAGMQPPKSVLCHSHWMMDNHKMSKSRGNVVDPFNRLETFTADGLRYFLLKEGVPHSDGNYNDQKVMECVNSDLGNTLGNLLNRCTATSLNPRQVFTEFSPQLFQQRASDVDKVMFASLQALPGTVDVHYRDYNIYQGLETIMRQLRTTNAFLQRHEPWQLRKDPGEAEWLDTVLHVAMETLRVSCVLLQPVVPTLACTVLDRLGVQQDQRTWTELGHNVRERNLGADTGKLFPRIKL